MKLLNYREFPPISPTTKPKILMPYIWEMLLQYILYEVYKNNFENYR
jgi:hypothetical protein